jgi:copper homeostasis protein
VRNRILLEISVESAERATAAERGGAGRIELCSNLAVGGLTPSRELMQAVRAGVKIPVFAMIRPRAGDFVYSSAELVVMEELIALAREMHMDGVVLGLLTRDRRVDLAHTRRLVEAAVGMEVTFHRAFDESVDLLEAVDAVAESGASRVLTSGGKATALEGSGMIAAMRERARGRVGILPGVGITAKNAAEIVRRTGAREIHAALSSVVCLDADAKTFEEEVPRLADALTGSECDGKE